MPELSITNQCNNKCLICSNPTSFTERSNKDFTYNSLAQNLDRFKDGAKVFASEYRDSFTLTGGEPTLSLDFFRVIEKIRKLFPKAQLTCLSNGRRFYYKPFAKQFLNAVGHIDLCVALHHHTTKMHDLVTQAPGSFKQTVKGLQHILQLKKPGQHIEIRVILHQLNYQSLPQLTRFIQKNFKTIDRLVFIFLEIEGEAYKNLKQLRLRHAQLYPYLQRLAARLPQFCQVRFYHFPLCVTPKALWPFTWRTLPESEVTYTSSCSRCTVKDFCIGIHRGYLQSMGSKEFKPFKTKIPIVTTHNIYHPIASVGKRG